MDETSNRYKCTLLPKSCLIVSYLVLISTPLARHNLPVNNSKLRFLNNIHVCGAY